MQAKLKLDFGINLPEVPETDDLSLDNYIDDVRKEIESKLRWEVLPNDSVLWFFSFAKFLMYRNLKPETWPAERPFEKQQLITSLLGDGFRGEPPIVSDSQNIDAELHPLDLIHVMDADSSQTVAIAVVVSEHLEITRTDASTEVARLFGFRSTSATLKDQCDVKERHRPRD